MILPVCATLQNSSTGNLCKNNFKSNSKLNLSQMPYDQVNFGDRTSAAKKGAEKFGKKLQGAANDATERAQKELERAREANESFWEAFKYNQF